MAVRRQTDFLIAYRTEIRYAVHTIYGPCPRCIAFGVDWLVHLPSTITIDRAVVPPCYLDDF